MEAAKNNVLPIGGGLYIPIFHPEERITPPYREWNFSGDITRMPEFAAPKLGNTPNRVTVTAEIPANANGVLYALGGFSAGLTCYVRDGRLYYEYNLFELQRTQINTRDKLPAGPVKIEVETSYLTPKPAGPMRIVIKVNDKDVAVETTFNGQPVKESVNLGGLQLAPGVVPVSAPLGFTANDCFDVGTDLGSPVSLGYFDNAPFKFNGKIEKVNIRYLDRK